MHAIFDLGIQLVLAIQGWGDWLKMPMEALSFLGTEDFFMFVLPVVYWCLDSRLGIRIAIILMFSISINGALKLAFHGPRPYWYSSDVSAFASETSFGVPSGHSQNSFAIWGMFAAWLKRWWAWLGALLIVFLVGVSRMYLGVHFPHDVLLGWLTGGILLWLVLRFWNPVASWLKKMSLAGQVLVAFLTSLVLLLVNIVPYYWMRNTGWQPDPLWAGFAGQTTNLDGILSAAGTFFGLGVGLIWIHHAGGFSAGGSWQKKILRILLGVAGVMILRYGLKFLFPGGDDLLAISLRYLRYALIGAWVSGGAPWVFLRLKLADE